MLWCGGNEFSPSRNRPLLQRLESAVAKSTSIPFSPVSPSQGEAHNWDVWHGQRPIASYRQDMTLFMSEFGLQALPDQETLTTVLVTPDQNWESRLGDSPKLLRYLLPFLDDSDRDRDSEDKAQQLSTTTLASLIDASQRAQAAGLQTAIEHMRRRKAQAGGVIAWQFNEPWPAISWAILDYYRRPKLAYKRLKLWYQPVLICLDLEPGQNWQPGQQLEAMLCGINDSLESVSGTVRVALDGVAIFEIAQVLLPPDSAIQLGMISYRLETKPKQLSLTLQQGQTEMARNVYDLTWQDEAAPDWLSRIRRLGATLSLK
jgi:beta-mannosidase